MAATTPLLAVVCQQMQQLPTISGPLEHHGKVRAHKTKLNYKETMCMHLHGPNNVGIKLCKQIQHCCSTYALATTEHKKCWELLAQTFVQFQTLHNNSQQLPTICNSVESKCLIVGYIKSWMTKDTWQWHESKHIYNSEQMSINSCLKELLTFSYGQ